jgi:hypothetical protein
MNANLPRQNRWHWSLFLGAIFLLAACEDKPPETAGIPDQQAPASASVEGPALEETPKASADAPSADIPSGRQSPATTTKHHPMAAHCCLSKRIGCSPGT